MKTYYLALDLINDPKLIAEYEEYHRKIWPEVADSIKSSGIQSLQIYRVENRLFMVMKTVEQFSFERKNETDRNNSVVQRWEELMWKYQQAIPGSAPGEKWRLLDLIFDLDTNS